MALFIVLTDGGLAVAWISGIRVFLQTLKLSNLFSIACPQGHIEPLSFSHAYLQCVGRCECAAAGFDVVIEKSLGFLKHGIET